MFIKDAKSKNEGGADNYADMSNATVNEHTNLVYVHLTAESDSTFVVDLVPDEPDIKEFMVCAFRHRET